MIDVIEGILKEAADDGTLKTATGIIYLKAAVRVAASLGRDVLNRYYSKTDDSVMYHCAMSKSFSSNSLSRSFLTLVIIPRSSPPSLQDSLLQAR